MGYALKNEEEYYTYADYLEWDTEKRYELIDGAAYLMAPGPSRIHQRVIFKISKQFDDFLEGKPCEVYVAPLDVRLNADAEDDTVVQPDILVVCDKSKLGEQSVQGAPDLVVEVLSPSSKHYDTVMKLERYMKAGVKECWLVDTENETVRVYINQGNGDDEQTKYAWDKAIPVGIFPGLSIDMKKVKAAL
jgi:Uma2 family endonuclease